MATDLSLKEILELDISAPAFELVQKDLDLLLDVNSV